MNIDTLYFTFTNTIFFQSFGILFVNENRFESFSIWVFVVLGFVHAVFFFFAGWRNGRSAETPQDPRCGEGVHVWLCVHCIWSWLVAFDVKCLILVIHIIHGDRFTKIFVSNTCAEQLLICSVVLPFSILSYVLSSIYLLIFNATA